MSDVDILVPAADWRRAIAALGDPFVPAGRRMTARHDYAAAVSVDGFVVEVHRWICARPLFAVDYAAPLRPCPPRAGRLFHARRRRPLLDARAPRRQARPRAPAPQLRGRHKARCFRNCLAGQRRRARDRLARPPRRRRVDLDALPTSASTTRPPGGAPRCNSIRKPRSWLTSPPLTGAEWPPSSTAGAQSAGSFSVPACARWTWSTPMADVVFVVVRQDDGRVYGGEKSTIATAAALAARGFRIHFVLTEHDDFGPRAGHPRHLVGSRPGPRSVRLSARGILARTPFAPARHLARQPRGLAREPRRRRRAHRRDDGIFLRPRRRQAGRRARHLPRPLRLARPDDPADRGGRGPPRRSHPRRVRRAPHPAHHHGPACAPAAPRRPRRRRRERLRLRRDRQGRRRSPSCRTRKAEFRILFVGSVCIDKGQLRFIERVVPRVVAEIPGAHVTMVGDPRDPASPARPAAPPSRGSVSKTTSRWPATARRPRCTA